jgi:hypothetical protein
MQPYEQTRIYIGEEAEVRLAELGLSSALVRRVVQRADGEARTCTAMDPTNLAGMIRWGRTNRFFREETYMLGWSYDNPKNLPRTIGPTGEFAVVATSGNEATGDERFNPSTRYAKGVATSDAIEANGQLAFQFVDEAVGVALGESTNDASSIWTWLLLYCVMTDRVQIELSLPSTVSRSGYVEHWRERIIISAVPFEEPSIQLASNEPLNTDGIEVKISRR